jgi:DNA replication protein DnaC
MRSSNGTHKPPPQIPIPIPTTATTASSDLAATLSLAEALRALGLHHAASILDVASQKAIARNDSPTSLLDHLMREELRVQTEHRALRALKRSALFPITAIDTYDFDYPKQIDRDLVMRAATLEFIAEKANCVFVGPSGVGKTHLANALGQLACLRGHRVKFTTAADLVNDLVAGQAKNTLQRRLAAWAIYDLLLVDELGYLSFDARGADLLYQVFNRRYQRTSTIVTTNLPFKDWGQLFPSAAAASAIADRLVHRGILVRIAGKSKRSDQEVE